MNLDREMTAKDVTSAEMARRLGLNEKTVRRWRSGEVVPDIDRLAEIGAVLDRDPVSFYDAVEATA